MVSRILKQTDGISTLITSNLFYVDIHLDLHKRVYWSDKGKKVLATVESGSETAEILRFIPLGLFCDQEASRSPEEELIERKTFQSGCNHRENWFGSLKRQCYATNTEICHAYTKLWRRRGHEHMWKVLRFQISGCRIRKEGFNPDIRWLWELYSRTWLVSTYVNSSEHLCDSPQYTSTISTKPNITSS
jgi:hypothetical protein